MVSIMSVCVSVCMLAQTFPGGEGIPEFKSARKQSTFIEVTGDMGICHTMLLIS